MTLSIVELAEVSKGALKCTYYALRRPRSWFETGSDQYVIYILHCIIHLDRNWSRLQRALEINIVLILNPIDYSWLKIA